MHSTQRFGVALILFVGGILLTVLQNVQGTDYQLVFDNEIIQPCENMEDKDVSKFLDLSGLNFELQDDDVMHVIGKIVLIKELPATPSQLMLQLYRKSRSDWISTIYNIKREDFCQSLFDSNEYWFNVTNVIPKQQRQCPLKKDFSLDIDLNIRLVVALLDKVAEGTYKAEARITYGSTPNDFICFEIPINMYKL